VPPVLAVLRHALADPLSAATAKAEVLSARLLREAPALATRAQDLGADLATAGRLLDLLSALAELAEESPEPTPLGRLVAPFGDGTWEGAGPGVVRVRPAAAAEAIRRVAAFGSARGGTPRVSARSRDGRAEVLFDGLGSAPGVPLEKLLLLPRDLPEADDLFIAHAAAAADGGSLRFTAGTGGLRATLSWPEDVDGP
jgi:hypothetical protein